jgi:hypothetical protein
MATGKDLRSGNTKSCGCLRDDTRSALSFKHGLTQTVIGAAWKHLIQRCFNPKDAKFYRYGARGIKPCEFIRSSPLNLLLTVGDKPSATHSLGRPNNDGGYWCGQCAQCLQNGWSVNIRWETPIQQANNKCNNRKQT